MIPLRLSQYTDLIKKFLLREISATEFERSYLDIFVGDKASRPRKELKILVDLFQNVDAFCSDPLLRNKQDIDGDQLRKECEKAYKDLKALYP